MGLCLITAQTLDRNMTNVCVQHEHHSRSHTGPGTWIHTQRFSLAQSLIVCPWKVSIQQVSLAFIHLNTLICTGLTSPGLLADKYPHILHTREHMCVHMFMCILCADVVEQPCPRHRKDFVYIYRILAYMPPTLLGQCHELVFETKSCVAMTGKCTVQLFFSLM